MVSSHNELDLKILAKESLEEVFNEEIKKARLCKKSLSLVILDLSESNQEEDLKKIIELLTRRARSADIIGKSKLKELTMVFPNMDKKEVVLFVHRLKQDLNYFKESLNIKVSFGFSSFPEDGRSKRELIEKATYLLYKDKILET
ncbi:diguanylate cyclase [bacterium]|nr:diguanylate cyclase [bacterium]